MSTRHRLRLLRGSLLSSSTLGGGLGCGGGLPEDLALDPVDERLDLAGPGERVHGLFLSKDDQRRQIANPDARGQALVFAHIKPADDRMLLKPPGQGIDRLQRPPVVLLSRGPEENHNGTVAVDDGIQEFAASEGLGMLHLGAETGWNRNRSGVGKAVHPHQDPP